ncbi:MAG: hypothetical protein FJ110_09975 [Deltaproteobacteria bacterium]|nr:hypothetical protein [Deltaproteobacteria bacterium]
MSIRQYQRWFLCISILLLGVTITYANDGAAKPGTRAVLEVEYLIDAKGHQGNVKKDTVEREWRVKRTVKAQTTLEAQPLQRAGISDPAVGKQMESQSKNIGSKADAMKAEHGETLEMLAKEAEKCGGDEACLARVAQKMSKRSDMGEIMNKSGAMAQQGNAMVSQAPSRFQPWIPLSDRARKQNPSSQYTYHVDEWSKKLYYDPGCGKTNNICTFTRKRTGSGTDTMPIFSSVEVDTVKHLISVDLGLPLHQLQMAEESTGPDKGPQANKITRQLVTSASDVGSNTLKLTGLPLKGSYRNQTGEKMVMLKNGVDDYPGPIQLTVRWRFTVQ